MGAVAPRAATAPAVGAAHRLEPGLYGQRVHPGKKGGVATGPNPTDRGKAGTKRHLLTDRHGLPLAFLLTGANVHDSVPLAESLDAVRPVKGRRGRPRQRPGKLHADKAYDYQRCRRACLQRGIQPRIARRGIDSGERLGRHRWVVERTPAWFARMRRLSIRYERRVDTHYVSAQQTHAGLSLQRRHEGATQFESQAARGGAGVGRCHAACRSAVGSTRP